MPHNNTTKGNTDGGNGLILLCAPSHDQLTEYTSKLLENFPSLGLLTVLRKFESPLTYDQLLSELPVDHNMSEVTVVFCGHGERTALLGPGGRSGAADYSELFSSFYNASHVHPGPTRILAFCCSAAAGLGDFFERNTTGRTFVGFKDDIPILLVGGDYADCLRMVLHGSASALSSAPDRGQLEKSIRKIYKDAIASFPPEKDNVHSWDFMRACLREQEAAIRFIQT